MSVKDLRQQVKERGLKGCSAMNKENLERVLAGQAPLPKIKKLRRNQVSVGVQTDLACDEEAMKAYIQWKAEAFREDERRRAIVWDGDVAIDSRTGEVVEYAVDCSTLWRYR